MEDTKACAGQEAYVTLHGKRYLIARIAWVILAVTSLAAFVISVPAYFGMQYRSLPGPERAALAEAGISLRFYSVYSVAIYCLTVLVFAATAFILFRRRSQEWVTLFVSGALLAFGVAVSPTMETLAVARPALKALAYFVQYVGVGGFLLVFYLFPDGRFVPRWSWVLAVMWTGWGLLWSMLPTAAIEPGELSPLMRFFSYVTSVDPGIISTMYNYVRYSSLLLVLVAWFGSGVLAQLYRYIKVSGPVQRQQTKWVVFGMVAAFIGYFGYNILRVAVPTFRGPGPASVWYYLIGEPISMLFLLLVPLSIRASALHHRLWDIDPIIQNTLVYGTLTGALALAYLFGVFVAQRIFRAFTGHQSDVAVVLITLGVAALVQPLRRRLQNFIDRHFYRERVDFRRAFTTFSREVRTIIELPELLRILIDRTMDLLHITHGAVFLRHSEEDRFYREKARNLPPDSMDTLVLEPRLLERLRSSLTVYQPQERLFSILVPLIAPKTEGSELVGVLGLGPRMSGQNYSREDRALLMGLADQAGTAIYVARLIDERQAEARRREEAERRLEAHRHSPIGRAEAFARNLLAEPETALIELHQLAQEAGYEPDAASLLDNLPRVLDSLGEPGMSRLAEGFNYLYHSQFEPEMLPVALRTLIAQLESSAVQYAEEALQAYRLCQQALDASTVAQIVRFVPALLKREKPADKEVFLGGLSYALIEAQSVAEALHAYERVDTGQDKLAYLASAIDRLRRVEYVARTELGSADRAIVLRVAENWLGVVTSAMSELQTRARIVCRLLTRHTWQDDVVSLALSLRNEGRGAALNLQVTLPPTPEYTALDEVARVERLAPGEESRVELRVRPHLAGGGDQFRARFVILYTDPRGPDQVEDYADVVRLLAVEGEFQFIPNPYVVGTPLEAGSPLFFGRQDVVAYIQENLAAYHRNNLVLVGQRRTGKTSLLKQLPVRLGDDYLPVYLDGQALGLDPGLPNFFLALATEIAFALEDRGIELELPEYEDFVESPAASFERDFLARVRRAIAQRHLLVMFDEFEELETAVQRGNLDPSVFGFLRHLVQHADNLSVIFCGTHRLEELAADYWNVLFNISLYRHIALLEKPEALRLIQEPVAKYGMRYDDLALDKMWQVTAGHPYFLQLLCHSLVNRHNRTERSYVTVADVNAALEEILASGEAHFVYLWAEASLEDRLVLAALSRMIPLTGHVTLVQVADYLAERGVNIERRAVSDALHHLMLRDILAVSSEVDPAVGEVYRWRLGLLGLWVEKYKSMGRIIDEARG
ncbi:MAG: AAA family ATPase [Anaerolineae bacterium]|nr:AAA family ATPase [Anaerolineae bacterium]